jgi:DegV family protein with EDD domain
MRRVRIVTDSTSDVPPGLAEQLGITVVPAYVQIEGKSLRDGDQITRAELYERLPKLASLPTTAAPPAYEFAAAFRNLVDQTEEVIAILVSPDLSGMMNSAYLGSQEVPELKVHLVDSGQVAMGLGWQAILAAEAAAAGESAREVLAMLEDLRPRVRLVAMLDTLDYLHRSGRVAWARAVAARLLRIKPLVDVYEGEVRMAGRVRTRRKAIDLVFEILDSLGSLQRLAALHTAAPADFVAFRERLGGLFPIEDILVSEVGPTVGTHVGPDGLGIAAVIAA